MVANSFLMIILSVDIQCESYTIWEKLISIYSRANNKIGIFVSSFVQIKRIIASSQQNVNLNAWTHQVIIIFGKKKKN